VTPSIT